MNFKKNLFNYISLAVGILGLISSYYFYTQSIRIKEPTYIVGKSEQIFSGNMFGEDKRFTLVDNSTHTSVNNSVFIQKLTFWNKGRDVIKSTDILTDLTFKYGEGTSLVDVSISESTRADIVKPNIKRFKEDSFGIQFNLLEENDGFTITVIYAAEAKAKPQFSGDILGVNSLTEESGINGTNFFTATLKISVVIFVIVFSIAALGYAGEAIAWVAKRFLPSLYNYYKTFFDKFGDKISTILSLVVIGAIAFAIIYSVAKDEIKNDLPKMESIHAQSNSSD